jgi:hypothetical protein
MYEFEIVSPKGTAYVYAESEDHAREIAEKLDYTPIISITKTKGAQ